VTPYPKHYLADVPQELRQRLLDLCSHWRFDDALNLLHQHGFTHYEFYEVTWFYWHAPTNLEPREPCVVTADARSAPEYVVPPSGGPGLPASSIEEPASQTLTPESPTLTLTPLRELRASVVKPSPVKVPKPRSKIARLSVDIQHNLNTLLAAGCPYSDIIRNLNDQGYPGFNKVNLHTWKLTGFQNWLCAENAEPSSEDVQKVSEGDQKPVKGDTNRY